MGKMSDYEKWLLSEGALAGLYLGIFVCAVFSLIVFPLLSKKRYIRKIKRAVKRYGLGDMQPDFFCIKSICNKSLHTVSAGETSGQIRELGGIPAFFLIRNDFHSIGKCHFLRIRHVEKAIYV